jgi:hypothetical protein
MTKPEEVISPDTLQRLVARAIELEAQGRESVSPARAREIAQELGIRPDAWEAAVLEYRHSNRGVRKRNRAASSLRTLMMAGLGLAAGAAASVIGQATGDVAAGAVLVAWSVAFAARARNAEGPNVYAQLAAWWAGIPVGIMMVQGEVLTDPLWFAAFSFIGSSALARLMPHLLRYVRGDESSGPPSTA